MAYRQNRTDRPIELLTYGILSPMIVVQPHNHGGQDATCQQALQRAPLSERDCHRWLPFFVEERQASTVFPLVGGKLRHSVSQTPLIYLSLPTTCSTSMLIELDFRSLAV